MKTLLRIAVVCVIALVPAFVQADEPPDVQLDFARKLRSRRMSRLALEFLEKLQKQPKLPPQLARVLPLEIARTQVSLAREASPAKRLELLASARQGLERYIAANKNKPETAQVKMEMARVTHYQGQALLSQARRQEDKDATKDYANKAGKRFDEAKAEFAVAIKGLDALLKTYVKPKDDQQKFFKQQLAKDLQRAKFDSAKINIDQAQTILGDGIDDRDARAKLLTKAKDMLKAVAAEGKEGTDQEVPSLAFAWLIHINVELQQPETAVNYYNALMSVGLPKAASKDQKTQFVRQYPYKALAATRQLLAESADPGLRWALYFYIQVLHKHPNPPIPKNYTKSKYIQLLGLTWQNAFPAHKTTAAGHGISFELGEAYLKQAVAISQNPKDTRAKKYYDKALEYFTMIANSDSDLAEQANQLIFPIQIRIIGERTPIRQLQSFADCVVKARFEMIKLTEVSAALSQATQPEKQKKLKKDQDQKFQLIIDAFKRALKIATVKTPPAKIDDARYYLAYIYLLAGDTYRAAVLAEHLARREPPGKRSPLAARYAIVAYQRVIEQHNHSANRQPLRELTEFVLTQRLREWQSEPVMALARYQLAMTALREQKHDEAIAHLDKLPKDFRLYTFSQAQLALTALGRLAKAKEKNNTKLVADYRDKALGALRRIPNLPKNTDAATAQMFFVAQVEHGKLLFTDASGFRKDGKKAVALARYREMAKFTNSLNQQFEEVSGKFNAQAKTGIGNALKALTMYARLGLGEMEYQEGAYKKVLGNELTGDTVNQIETLGQGQKTIAVADFQVVGELLGLAMRANVQLGNTKKAMQLLELVQKLKGTGGQISDPTVPLKRLISEMNQQVKQLEKLKDKAKLKTFTLNFTKFFDAILKAKNAKKLDHNTVFFMARSYQILDQFQKAADLYGSIPKAADFDPKAAFTMREQRELQNRLMQVKAIVGQQIGKDLTDPKILLTANEKTLLNKFEAKVRTDFVKWRKAEHQKKIYLWWFIQVYRAESLRKAKKLDEAEKLVNQIMNDKKAVGKLRAWKEQNHLLEDRALFGRAISAWSKLLGSPALKQRLRNDPSMKSFYFDCYYQFVWCWYMYSQSDNGRKNEERYLKRAADYIVRLELAKNQEGWNFVGDKMQQLLKDAPRLNRFYQQLKKEKTAAAG